MQSVWQQKSKTTISSGKPFLQLSLPYSYYLVSTSIVNIHNDYFFFVFQRFPDQELLHCSGEEAIEAHFMSTVKEVRLLSLWVFFHMLCKLDGRQELHPPPLKKKKRINAQKNAILDSLSLSLSLSLYLSLSHSGWLLEAPFNSHQRNDKEGSLAVVDRAEERSVLPWVHVQEGGGGGGGEFSSAKL